jgi:Rps23 Pro-64 3,4-dihydroxylase Tpa1-like proline 4-hydroxylase
MIQVEDAMRTKNATRSSVWPPVPKVPIVRCEEFLVAQELTALVEHVLAQGPNFTSSRVTREDAGGTFDPTQRRSRVLFNLGWFGPVFSERLRFVLPHVLFRLGRPSFAVTGLEMQLTASNDGDFFRPHTDSGSGDTGGRDLTFVYFFHREPRGFSGGALRIFAAKRDDGESEYPSITIEPAQNEIVFFPSHLLHEILPVRCPSRAFSNSRFTANGWFRK